MISTARTALLLALFATVAAPLAPAQAAWMDWFANERVLVRGEDAPKTEPGQKVAKATVERGDTLLRVLVRLGVAYGEASRAFDAMQDFADPNRLQIGDNIVATLSDGSGQAKLVALHVDFLPDQVSLTLVRGQDGSFHAASVTGGRPSLVVETVKGKVNKSFRPSLLAAGVPSMLADDVIRGLEFDPNLPTRIKSGATFQVIYERLGATTGRKPGDRLRLRYVELSVAGKPHRFYHYAPPGAEPKFFDESGRALENVRFITPIEGGKVNSPFGMRMHPVLRKMRMHRGVDFPAPQGTPIMAAADGVVEDMGWRGNYGNFLRIDHDGRHASTYGHLHGFAPSIKEGDFVKQGQIIGYVGRSGLASGNHLYWEVLIDNKHVDPMKVRLVQAATLKGPALQKFQRFVKETHTAVATN